jgi:hypothetical protein
MQALSHARTLGLREDGAVTRDVKNLTSIGGVFGTEIYATDDGFVAIEQTEDTVVLLVPDELLSVIRELQAYYDSRARWQEPQPG